jgi:hypothetical protein
MQDEEDESTYIGVLKKSKTRIPFTSTGNPEIDKRILELEK